LVIASNAGCAAMWAGVRAFAFVVLMGVPALVILLVARKPTHRSRTLVQLASGLICGLCIQPSSAALVGVLTAGFSLGSVPRMSFLPGLALFLIGVAVGAGALQLTMSTPPRC
jgi:hypothetical protein